MSDTNNQLKEAQAYLKTGNRAAAMEIITTVLKADRTNAEAWYWAAQASENRDEQCAALKKVLGLDPQHGAARQLARQIGCDLKANVRTTTKAVPVPTFKLDWRVFFALGVIIFMVTGLLIFRAVLRGREALNELAQSRPANSQVRQQALDMLVTIEGCGNPYEYPDLTFEIFWDYPVEPLPEDKAQGITRRRGYYLNVSYGLWSTYNEFSYTVPSYWEFYYQNGEWFLMKPVERCF